MKNENIIYAICTAIVLIGGAIKIFHLSSTGLGDIVFNIGFLGIIVLMGYQNNKLRKRNKELEK